MINSAFKIKINQSYFCKGTNINIGGFKFIITETPKIRFLGRLKKFLGLKYSYECKIKRVKEI